MIDNTDRKQLQRGIGLIDLGKILRDILKYKWYYIKLLPVAFVVAAIYALSIPNYYTCAVKLAPEAGSGAKASGGLAGIASSFGINLGAAQSGTDAISPNLYPDMMSSVDFKTSLFPIIVTRKSDGKSFTYYEYLENEQKMPWWSSILRGSRDKNENSTDSINPFELTREQASIVKLIDKNLSCSVDKKTLVITIVVSDQDPLVCATLADSVKTRLQNFITDYRTRKARVDLEYYKKMYVESKVKYEKAREKYASFSDSHRDVTSQSGRTKEANLLNEMQIQQTVYQQVVGQLQQAEMKVQQETPAFTTLQSATVPILKAGPKRVQICLIALLAAFFIITAFILFKESDYKSFLGKK